MEKSLQQLFIEEFEELNEIPTHQENLSFSQTVSAQLTTGSVPVVLETNHSEQHSSKKQRREPEQLASQFQEHSCDPEALQVMEMFDQVVRIRQMLSQKNKSRVFLKALTQATTSFILTEKIKARDKYKDIYIHERNKALMKGASDKKRAPKVKSRKCSGNSPSIFEALTQIAREADEKERIYHEKLAQEAYIQEMMRREDQFNKRASAGSFDYGSLRRNDMMAKELEHTLNKRRSVSPQIAEDMKEDDSSSEDLKPSEIREVVKKKQKKRGSSSISNQMSLKKQSSSGPRPLKAKASQDTHISTAAESNLTLSNKQKCSKGSSILFDENIVFNDTQVRNPHSRLQFSPQFKNVANMNQPLFLRNTDAFSPRDTRYNYGSDLAKWKFAKRGSEGSAETYMIYDQRGAIPVIVESPHLSVKSPKTPRRLSAILPRNPNLNLSLNSKTETHRKSSSSSMRSQSKPTGGRRTPLMYSGIQVMSPGRGIPYEERPKRLKYAYVQSNRIDSKNLKAEVTEI